jgi:hypothetical protein
VLKKETHNNQMNHLPADALEGFEKIEYIGE